MNALDELKRMDTPAAEPNNDVIPTETVALKETREIIELANGISVYMLDENELAGSEYFEFLRESRENGTEAGIQYLMFQCFRVVSTGKALQPDQILEEIDHGGIGFVGVSKLSEHVVKLFPAAQASEK